MPSPDAISTRHFEIFLTMVLSRGMAEAADKLGISLPAVSKSLKTLERETGLTLFRHVNGRLTPTTEAERLLPYAQRALDHLERAREMATALRGGNAGQIVIGTAGPAMTSLLPSAIGHFHKSWPDIRIELQIDSTSRLLEKVAGNEVDIGIGTPLVRDIDARIMQLLQVEDLCEDWLVAVFPQGHHLTRQPTIRPQDLIEETLIGLPIESATTNLIHAIFQQAGVSVDSKIVAANAVGVCSLVQQGIGVGLLNPLVLANGIFPGVHSIPFRPRIKLRTCIYYSKLHQPTAPVLRMRDSLRQAVISLQKSAG
ncbi:LysR family transcriptional regulator [Ferrovibrio sp.]|uniref:LysR family transcriptional regulator n=1 Tax=Ferrovibrio sp. TaxID=1917215 RepID=UPI0026331804|nr:LysR family transcriptional regulator [Ferrovibrio sp.]